MGPREGHEGELRLADIGTLLTIVRSGSISGAARALRVTPSQVSKAVTRLEGQLQLQLLTRGARGVAVSEAGKRLMPQLEDLLVRARALHRLGERPAPELTVVAAAYLNTLFLPRIVERLPRFRIRSLELPPGIASAYASERAFDLALTTGTERWPGSWARIRIGSLRKGVYTTPTAARALGPAPVLADRLRGASFIGPIYSYYGQVVPGDDGCPIPYSHRRVGHQTQTLALALALAERSGELVFCPELAARPFVERGALTEVAVAGWDVRDALFLVCDAERVRSRVQKEIAEALRAAL